jgi:hypothetical protein
MKTRRAGFLGIKKAVKSVFQTKKQNARMYKLSRKRQLKRLQKQAEESRRKHTVRIAERKEAIENAAYGGR